MDWLIYGEKSTLSWQTKNCLNLSHTLHTQIHTHTSVTPYSKNDTFLTTNNLLKVLEGPMCCAVLHLFSQVWLFSTLWTVARQAPLSMGFSRQEYWSGLPGPYPGDFTNPGIEPMCPAFPALQAIAGRFFTHWATWEGPIAYLTSNQ